MVALLLAAAAAAGAQQHDGHSGHAAPDPHAGHAAPDPHAGHAAPDPHAGHGAASPAIDEPAVGDSPPPAAPADHAADAVWGARAMAHGRHQLEHEAGGFTGAMLLVERAEWQPRHGRDHWRLDGEAWFGGDLHRLVVKAEGEGEVGEPLDHAEARLLYSRAITPFFNLQGGLRHDLEPRSRTYASVGVEGLAPYWIRLAGALFLSGRGDLLARLEGSYDQRLTQRLIVQPRAELNFAAQDVPATGTAAGLSAVELGLRLRLELTREFAPYVGVEWARSFGRMARAAIAEERGSAQLLAGVRFWW